MKTVYKISTGLCGLIALLSLFMGTRILTGRSWGISWMMFSMFRREGFMGVMGSIIGIIFAVACFGYMAYCGIKDDILSRRNGLIAGIIMTAATLISMIAALVGHHFSAGDMIMFAIPALYTISTVLTA